MAAKRKVHIGAPRTWVALRSEKTVNELAGHYGVQRTLIPAWEKLLLAGAASSDRAIPANERGIV